MFYCNDCAKENDWPSSLVKSHGKCEVCGNRGECNDRPSKTLGQGSYQDSIKDQDIFLKEKARVKAAIEQSKNG